MKITCTQEIPVVRGFIPDGLRSGPNTAISFIQTYRICRSYDCFAAERG